MATLSPRSQVMVFADTKIIDAKKTHRKLRRELTRGSNRVNKRSAGAMTSGFRGSLPKSQSKIKATHQYRRAMRAAYGTLRTGIKKKKKRAGSVSKKLGFLASRWGVSTQERGSINVPLRKNASDKAKKQREARMKLKESSPNAVPNLPQFHEFGAYGRHDRRHRAIPESQRSMRGSRTHRSGKKVGSISGNQYLDRWIGKFKKYIGSATQKEVKRAAKKVKTEMKRV